MGLTTVQGEMLNTNVWRKNFIINGNFDIWQRTTTYMVTKRTTPTLYTITIGNASGFAVSNPDFWTADTRGFGVGKIATATLTSGFYYYSYTVDAELGV